MVDEKVQIQKDEIHNLQQKSQLVLPAREKSANQLVLNQTARVFEPTPIQENTGGYVFFIKNFSSKNCFVRNIQWPDVAGPSASSSWVGFHPVGQQSQIMYPGTVSLIYLMFHTDTSIIYDVVYSCMVLQNKKFAVV